MEMLLPVLGSLIPAIPLMAVEVVMLVLAINRWNLHPRISMFAATSAVMLLLLDLIAHAGFAILPLKLMQEGRSSAQISVIYTIIGGASGLLHALAFSLLIVAVFSERALSPAARAPFSPGR